MTGFHSESVPLYGIYGIYEFMEFMEFMEDPKPEQVPGNSGAPRVTAAMDSP